MGVFMYFCVCQMRITHDIMYTVVHMYAVLFICVSACGFVSVVCADIEY